MLLASTFGKYPKTLLSVFITIVDLNSIYHIQYADEIHPFESLCWLVSMACLLYNSILYIFKYIRAEARAFYSKEGVAHAIKIPLRHIIRISFPLTHLSSSCFALCSLSIWIVRKNKYHKQNNQSHYNIPSQSSTNIHSEYYTRFSIDILVSFSNSNAFFIAVTATPDATIIIIVKSLWNKIVSSTFVIVCVYLSAEHKQCNSHWLCVRPNSLHDGRTRHNEKSSEVSLFCNGKNYSISNNPFRRRAIQTNKTICMVFIF